MMSDIYEEVEVTSPFAERFSSAEKREVRLDEDVAKSVNSPIPPMPP